MNTFGLKKIIGTFLLLTAFAFILTFHVNCSGDSTGSSDSTAYLNHSDTARYVGMQVCKACHYDKYETFMHTGMGQSFAEASAGKSSARFSGHDLVYDAKLNFYYKPYFSGGKMYIMEFRLDGRDTVHKRVEQVDYIVGSGQHTNSHMYTENGYIYQMPLTFYTQQGRWDLPPGFENGNNSRFSRTIELECMSCHNAYPDIVSGSKNKYHSVLQGIDCERCHGPGSIHAQQKALGNLVDTATHIDYTIVNPKKLSYELQVDVCQRCHLQGNAVLKEGKSFFDFKPGQKLSDYMNVFLPRYTDDKQFIMASHADRLKQSRCFVQSNAQKIRTGQKKYVNSPELNESVSSLTCISCHNPHVSIKETKDAQFNDACKSCHGSKEYAQLPECTEKMSARRINNDNCWKCHMPSTGTIDIPHVTVHDHKIQKPIKQLEQQAVKRFIGIAAINNPNPDPHIKGEAYLSYFEKFDAKKEFLDSAAFYLDQKGSYSETHLFDCRVRLYFLKNDARAISALASQKSIGFSKDSWTLYRIGDAYAETGNQSQALAYYKASVEQSPYILEFRNKLAGMQTNMEDYAAAKKNYEFIVKENPKFVQALSNLGYIYLRENRLKEAEDLYNRATSLDPDYEPAIFNKIGLYLYTGRRKEAEALLRSLLKKNPSNQQARQILSELNV
jgi:tetratricopeptide (TPR) repeat protein